MKPWKREAVRRSWRGFGTILKKVIRSEVVCTAMNSAERKHGSPANYHDQIFVMRMTRQSLMLRADVAGLVIGTVPAVCAAEVLMGRQLRYFVLVYPMTPMAALVTANERAKHAQSNAAAL